MVALIFRTFQKLTALHSRVSTIHVHFHKENIPAPPIFDLQA